MKVYKNPFVSRECYFVKTGKGHSYKMEASKSKGYIVEFIEGKWEVREGCYYDNSLRNEMPVIGENKVSIKSVIDRAIVNAVLDLVGETKDVREKLSNEKRLIDYDKMYLSVMDVAFSSCDEDTIFDIMDDSVVDASEVAPVRNGRWDIDEFGHYCTVCREYGPEIEGDAEIVDLLKYGTPYCPNCGAKMDGDGDGQRTW